jgi:hypothetical protein
MPKRKNFYVSEAATLGGIEAGIQWLQNEIKQGVSAAWLVSATKSALDGMIGEAIGAGAAKELAKGRTVRIGDGYLFFFSEKQLPTVARGAAILLIHPSQKLIEKTDNLRDATSLAVVPWLMKEVAHWLAAYAPQDILGQQQNTPQSIRNPVVARAMESIWTMINASSGMTHPRDRNRVIDAFRILRKGHEDVDPQEIRSWLLQRGMKPKYAEEIATVAANPSGSRKSSSSSSWAENILDKWRG